MLLQAASVVAVIQDKLRSDKNKFESYPLVWSALNLLFYQKTASLFWQLIYTENGTLVMRRGDYSADWPYVHKSVLKVL
jgi:hypothetical protein